MATDSRVLLAGLQEYQRVLEKHLSSLINEFQQLDNYWKQFSSVYEGTAADEFRAGWMRTAQRFQEYIEQTQKIKTFLEKGIEDLSEVDRPVNTGY
jgi:uncharacterized protein YukE